MGKFLGFIFLTAGGWIAGGVIGTFMDTSTDFLECLFGSTGVVGAAVGFLLMFLIVLFSMKKDEEVDIEIKVNKKPPKKFDGLIFCWFLFSLFFLL